MQLNDGAIEVGTNSKMEGVLDSIFGGDDSPTIIIESGPYLGTGTSRVLIESVKRNFKSCKVGVHYAIEANKDAFEVAKCNLKNHPWVKVIHGFSVLRDRAVNFMQSDSALINHYDYPDIKIDNLSNPILYYATETSPQCTGISELDYEKQDYINRIVNNYSAPEDRIFFCLDSCGGMGWYEFQKVLDVMKGKEFYIMLDDTDHIKHFRSRKHIEENLSDWTILYDDGRVMVSKRSVCEVSSDLVGVDSVN